MSTIMPARSSLLQADPAHPTPAPEGGPRRRAYGLSTLSPALFRTARSLGAPPLVALWTVVLPANRVAVIAGAAFAFLHSWDELVVTLFVSSRTIQTLPKLMWDVLQDNLDPIIAAVSVLLLFFSTALLLLAGLRAQIQTQRAPAD
jgi:putative spermidine/putrescine transport system permease protein